MRAVQRAVVAACVVITMALVFVLLLVSPPDAVAHEPQPAQPARSAATPADADALPAASAAAAARTAAGAEPIVTFEVFDAATAQLLDGVRIRFGTVERAVDVSRLAKLGTTVDGRLPVAMTRVAAAQQGAKVVLTREGYLPSRVAPPVAAGVCRVAMAQGRVAWVRVVDRKGAAVHGARVAFLASLVDLGPLAGVAGAGECIAGGEGAWFASVACDADGYASIALPDRDVSVLASCLGWFQAASTRVLAVGSAQDTGTAATAGAGLLRVIEAAGERGRAAEIVMHPVHCAVLAVRPSRVLGKSLRTIRGPQWKQVHGIFASDVAEHVQRTLSQRFPGDLVIAECVVPRSPALADAPESRFKVLVDGVGELDVTARLQPYSDVRLEQIRSHARPAEPLGNLVVDARPGFSDDWPSPLSVVRDDGTRTPTSFRVRYGDRCAVPVGRYRVREVASPPAGMADLGVVDVTAGADCRVEVERFPARWPVLLHVADEQGASPGLCTLRIRRRDDEREWRWSPSGPGHVLVFLDEGSHEVLAATDAKSWHRTEIAVRATNNTFDVRVEW